MTDEQAAQIIQSLSKLTDLNQQLVNQNHDLLIYIGVLSGLLITSIFWNIIKGVTRAK